MLDAVAPQHRALAQKFSALADPTRLAIAERLMERGEMAVGELAEPFDISAPAISRHLAVLERAGLIERKVDRQFRICRVRPDAMRSLADWLEQHRTFWTGALDRLETLFTDAADKEKS